jgi:hypothetical protein
MVVYLALLHIGRKLYPQSQFPKVQRLPFGLYCKHAGCIDKAEVFATMFVAANTSIPVPTIIDAIGPDEDMFVVMTRLPGNPFLRCGSISLTIHVP